MKQLTLILLLLPVLTLAAFSPELISDAQADDIPRVTADELKAELGAPDLVILDVRRGKDWEASEFKIVGATYFDPKQADEHFAAWDKGKRYVLYCA